MKKCKTCDILILDQTVTCPFCHRVLTDAGECANINLYPDIRQKSRRRVLILRIAFFICLLVTFVCGYINYEMQGLKPPWSILVGVCLFYAYFLIRLMSDQNSGYVKRTILAVLCAVAATILIDVAFGYHRWSFNFVLPGSLIVLDIVLIVLMILNRRNWQSYMMVQIMFIIIGMGPLVLIKMGVVTHPLLSKIAFIACFFVFVGTCIFGGRTAKQELRRRFHI